MQLSSHNQYIVNYSLHQTPADTTTLKQHLKSFRTLYNSYPEVLVADAGYGSGENYLLLVNRKIKGYVKHNQFDRQQRSGPTDWFKGENLEYDQQKDVVYCPVGESLSNLSDGGPSRTFETASFFIQP